MLLSIEKLFRLKLGASDGEIGQVQDFYFDDENWAIRYLIADTGTWLPGRQVLLSPHAFGTLHQDGKLLRVHLTRKQIEASPSIELHKPVSRQYEEEYFQYYGWPFYWQGGGLWGMSDIPVLERPSEPLPVQRAAAGERAPEGFEAHLRSTQAVMGYHIKAIDGMIGHVGDLMMNPQSWAIGQLVIKTGHWLSGREVQIPTRNVDRISYEESTVFVKLTRAAIEQATDQPPVSGQYDDQSDAS